MRVVAALWLYYGMAGRYINRSTVVQAQILVNGPALSRLPSAELHSMLQSVCMKMEVALCLLIRLILLEQIRTVDKRRLREHMGRLDDAHMLMVNDAIAVSFGLNGSDI